MDFQILQMHSAVQNPCLWGDLIPGVGIRPSHSELCKCVETHIAIEREIPWTKGVRGAY